MKTDDSKTKVDFLRRNEKEIIIRTTREDGEVIDTIARVVPPERKDSARPQSERTNH
jgi:hypothetical protein